MDWHNPEGIPRSQLLYALGNRKMVENARKTDICLLCCRHNVNEAGLCTWCWASLDNPELSLAEKWTSGVGP